MPDALHFTDDAEANTLLARDSMALLIGFRFVSGWVRMARGTWHRALRRCRPEKPAGGVSDDLVGVSGRSAGIVRTHPSTNSGDAARVWSDAADGDDLRRRIGSLPGFGEMKIKALGAVLAKRFGVEQAQALVPPHPTLGDVDSPEALAKYQAAKREYKASLRA